MQNSQWYIVHPISYSEHSARSDECWNASDSRASAVLCKTFTPSKKNMSHTLRTDGHGSVLQQNTTIIEHSIVNMVPQDADRHNPTSCPRQLIFHKKWLRIPWVTCVAFSSLWCMSTDWVQGNLSNFIRCPHFGGVLIKRFHCIWGWLYLLNMLMYHSVQ